MELRQVTKDAFYARMKLLNVTPRSSGRYDNVRRDFFTEWVLPNGRIVGTSFGNEYRIDQPAVPARPQE